MKLSAKYPGNALFLLSTMTSISCHPMHLLGDAPYLLPRMGRRFDDGDAMTMTTTATSTSNHGNAADECCDNAACDLSLHQRCLIVKSDSEDRAYPLAHTFNITSGSLSNTHMLTQCADALSLRRREPVQRVSFAAWRLVERVHWTREHQLPLRHRPQKLPRSARSASLN